MAAAIFIGHGSPMNAIEQNEFTKEWKKIADTIAKPKAILAISAHWVTQGTQVSTVEKPDTIYDFYGFPRPLYEVKYNPAGSPAIGLKTLELLKPLGSESKSWGIDHGTWSVLNIMYPEADIPVFQLSIDQKASPQELFCIGEKIKGLREEDVMIFGSGNVVHNLGMMDYSVEGGFEWAEAFDQQIEKYICDREFSKLFQYSELGMMSKKAVPTTEHLAPLFTVLGASKESDHLQVYNRACMAGSLSMTSFVFS